MRTVKILSTLDCLPMIAQPYVVQPLETVLPLHLMSARLEYAQVKELPRMLPELTASATFAAKRHRASQARDAFSWGVGGLAYNYTILALCHRAVELRGTLKAGPTASCAALAGALPAALSASTIPGWVPEHVLKATHKLQADRRRLAAAAAATVGPADRNAQIDYGP